MSDLAENIQLGLLQSTAVLKDQILIIRLDCECGYHALVRLPEEVHPHVKVEWIVFNHRRVHR